MNGELFDSGLWCRHLVYRYSDGPFNDLATDCGRPAVTFHVQREAVIMRCHDHPVFDLGYETMDLPTYMVRQVMDS